jgi:sulfofructose kinase
VESRKPEIVTLGYCAIDHLFEIERFPAIGGKQRMTSYERQGGGQAATAAVALSRWGCRVRFIGRVGGDASGRDSIEWLRAENVITDSVLVTPGATTQFAMIVIDKASGERTIFWMRSPQLNLTPADVKPEWFSNVKVLLEDAHEPEAALQAARLVKAQGGIVVLDAEEIGPQRKELLALTDICVGSSDFGITEFGEADPAKTIERLRELGVTIAGVTLGAEGCLADWGRGLIRFPGFSVKAVDTTGAGDIFHAALAFGALRNWTPERIFPFANACAAFSCRRIGGRPAIPSPGELSELGWDVLKRD